MCGIFGFISFTTQINKQREIASKLFKLSESRGMEASGFARITDNSISVFKTPVKGSKIIHTKEFKLCFSEAQKKHALFIGHSRLATNGIETDNHNNQPINTNRSICIHNGIIVNVDYLWNKYSKLLKRNFSLDTEILTRLFDYYYKKTSNPISAIQKTYKIID
jgi:glutamine---fructose-6-phosphate transaminase (isomerizing)